MHIGIILLGGLMLLALIGVILRVNHDRQNPYHINWQQRRAIKRYEAGLRPSWMPRRPNLFVRMVSPFQRPARLVHRYWHFVVMPLSGLMLLAFGYLVVADSHPEDRLSGVFCMFCGLLYFLMMYEVEKTKSKRDTARRESNILSSWP